MTKSTLGKYRRTKNRCTASLHAARRSGKVDTWRCQLVKGHTGDHETRSGHRSWSGGRGITVREFEPTDEVAAKLVERLCQAASLSIEGAEDVQLLEAAYDTAADVERRIRDRLEGML